MTQPLSFIPGQSIVVNQVYRTYDYSIFKNLVGNRSINKNSIKDIRESMRENGWLGAPAVVNEYFEKIDGQTRIQAAEDTCQPVEFIIKPGYGIKECSILNQSGRQWNWEDHTDSWASRNVDTYQWMKAISEQYPSFSLYSLIGLCNSKGKSFKWPSGSGAEYKAGKFVMEIQDRIFVKCMLDWLVQYDKAIKCIGGRAFIMRNALLFCYYYDNIDKDVLYDVVNNNRDKIVSSHSVIEYLKQIETLYNASVLTDDKHVHLVKKFKEPTKKSGKKTGKK